MNFFDNLKQKVDKSETKEEKKKLIEETGVQLTYDELNKVAGGAAEEDNEWARYYDALDGDHARKRD